MVILALFSRVSIGSGKALLDELFFSIQEQNTKLWCQSRFLSIEFKCIFVIILASKKIIGLFFPIDQLVIINLSITILKNTFI